MESDTDLWWPGRCVVPTSTTVGEGGPFNRHARWS